MATVRINTADLDWLRMRAVDPQRIISCGTDARGRVYFTAAISVAAVERVKFAGASMIRFDLQDAPRDHSRWAMYPDTYLVEG